MKILPFAVILGCCQHLLQSVNPASVLRYKVLRVFFLAYPSSQTCNGCLFLDYITCLRCVLETQRETERETEREAGQ